MERQIHRPLVRLGGRPLAERLADTHTLTPTNWASGEGGGENTVNGARANGAQAKKGPPRASERMLEDTGPADRPPHAWIQWVSPQTIAVRTRWDVTTSLIP